MGRPAKHAPPTTRNVPSLLKSSVTTVANFAPLVQHVDISVEGADIDSDIEMVDETGSTHEFAQNENIQPDPTSHASSPLHTGITIEDVPDEDDDPDPEDSDDDLTDLADELNQGLSIDNLMDETLEQELAEHAPTLSDVDLPKLHQFAYKIQTHATEKAFAKLAFAFPNDDVASWKLTKAYAESLSQFKPSIYDCCINSCMCYVGPHADEPAFPYCKEP
ncbi:hypothetical protein BT96DRAFT_995073 [Gymnopus androsaceus JB14]|uniref:Uncharacterized protein n=1 Tax=Gymnopus androsaceus JB14 TaxID=1447944 RepID=A0A6A4HMW7_9AGAR|nr:hypothetical protein BT96DRAFT_995073 [Gymnopus androsaceus JB14]